MAVRVDNMRGFVVDSTVGVVQDILKKKDLSKRIGAVLPGSKDKTRAEGGKLHGYYERLNEQHFNPATAKGSVFSELRSIDELVEVAVFAGTDLSTADHRERISRRMLKNGWSAEDVERTLKPGVRYVQVRTPGLNGMAQVGALATREDASSMRVRAERLKPGVPVSFVVSGGETPVERTHEEWATLIIGDLDGRDVVFTAHPGLPVPSSNDEPVDVFGTPANEGDEMSLLEFRYRYPDRDLLKVDAAAPQEGLTPLPAFSDPLYQPRRVGRVPAPPVGQKLLGSLSDGRQVVVSTAVGALGYAETFTFLADADGNILSFEELSKEEEALINPDSITRLS